MGGDSYRPIVTKVASTVDLELVLGNARALGRTLRPDRGVAGGFTAHPDYVRLPRGIRDDISSKEYAWMTDEQREGLVDSYVYPDWDEPDAD